MSHLTALEVGKLKVYQPWTAAPIGTLLQLSHDGSVIVGIRSKIADADLPLLLLLEGGNAGLLVGTHTLGPGAAIDVSEELEICVKDAGPPPRTPHPLPIGRVYADPTSGPNPAALMRAQTNGSGGVVCFICLSGSERGQPVATVERDPRILLGEAVLLPKKRAA